MRARTQVVLALAWLLPCAALAQEGTGRDEEARALFEAGEIAYRDGRFAEAEEHFRRSYELSGRVELLYNVALAADHARHDRPALEAYEEYLERVPDTDRRTRVEVRIGELRRLLETGEAAPPLEGTPTPASRGPDPAPWIVVGISAAALVVGAVFVGLALADVSAIENAPMDSAWADVADAYGRSEAFSIAGFVLGGVGIAGLAVGIGWGVASGSSSESSTALLVGPGRVALRGTW